MEFNSNVSSDGGLPEEPSVPEYVPSRMLYGVRELSVTPNLLATLEDSPSSQLFDDHSDDIASLLLPSCSPSSSCSSSTEPSSSTTTTGLSLFASLPNPQDEADSLLSKRADKYVTDLPLLESQDKIAFLLDEHLLGLRRLVVDSHGSLTKATNLKRELKPIETRDLLKLPDSACGPMPWPTSQYRRSKRSRPSEKA